jgi:hypothetical protein
MPDRDQSIDPHQLGFRLHHPAGQQLEQLTSAIVRLAEAVERQVVSLGSSPLSRYTKPPDDRYGMVDERAMAQHLQISPRTLGEHRRRGRLPGCWIRNGGRIWWRVAETCEAWGRGIA